MKVCFIHPDLGIGGAERLIVDAVLALKSKKHEVCIVTNYHDRQRCFPETAGGQIQVVVSGSFIPRSLGGRCLAFFAYLRMIFAALWLCCTSSLPPFDVIVVDQVSACLPVLRCLCSSKLVFYCHFPDQLLTKRESFLKLVYRCVLDWVEETTTGLADCVLVNSRFTEQVFRETFRSLAKVPVCVLYPSLHTNAFDVPLSDVSEDDLQFSPASKEFIFLSLNRFERKKNLPLAVSAFALLLRNPDIQQETLRKCHLVIAGGYDERVRENIEHYRELQAILNDLGLTSKVTMLKSPSEEIKLWLLKNSTAVLYTPENEHFGIVPLEAMYCGCPVIAANSGGPLETVLDGETGFLCKPVSEEFAKPMLSLINDRSLRKCLSENGSRHVKEKFSFEHFAEQWQQTIAGFMSSRTAS